MDYKDDPKLPAPPCGWVWVGATDGAWHRCDRKLNHTGLHKEEGYTYMKGEKA